MAETEPKLPQLTVASLRALIRTHKSATLYGYVTLFEQGGTWLELNRVTVQTMLRELPDSFRLYAAFDGEVFLLGVQLEAIETVTLEDSHEQRTTAPHAGATPSEQDASKEGSGGANA